MEFPVGRRRHPNTCRAEAVGTRISCGVDRHETGPPASSDGVPDVTRQSFLPVASVVFAAFAPCLTVDFKLYSCDNL